MVIDHNDSWFVTRANKSPRYRVVARTHLNQISELSRISRPELANLDPEALSVFKSINERDRTVGVLA